MANGRELEDDALLQELENNGQWEEARSWAGQLDLSSQRSSPALHHVTEIQVWNVVYMTGLTTLFKRRGPW